MHLLIICRRIKTKVRSPTAARSKQGKDQGPWFFAHNWCSVGWEKLDIQHTDVRPWYGRDNQREDRDHHVHTMYN
jgi:hypothetical protein